MFASIIHPKDRMEDLHGGVGIHRGRNFADVVEIAIDKFAQAHIILDRPSARASTDK